MLSPSILDSNFAEIKSTISLLDRAKVEYIHFDVMDGNFVPNLTFGPKIMQPLRPLTSIPFDTHLMILHPEKYAPLFIEAGADIITVHQEASSDLASLIKMIHASGKKAGVAIKPGTPSSTLYKYMDSIDLILVMSVEPGFGGQKFMADMLEKASDFRQIIDRNKYSCLIEIDGGINKTTAPAAFNAGVDIFVAGSAIFGSGDPEASITELRKSFA
jgi:ribulose-phosphate 3-epimerase